MGKKIEGKRYILSDKIVLDSIEAINEVMKNIEGFIGGGMAIQSYLPPGNHRGSIDIDTDSFLYGGKGAFEKSFSPAMEYLTSKGYRTNLVKRGFTYDIGLKKDEDFFTIQHPRRTKKNLDKRKPSLEREISNKRMVSAYGLHFLS